MYRLFYFLKVFRHDFLVMLFSLRDKRTPKAVKGLLALTLLYLVSPVDLIPDSVPLLGWVDDATIVPAAVMGLTHLLPAPVREACEDKAQKVAHRAPIIVLVTSLLVLAWVALVCWGLYTFLRWVFGG